MRPLVTIIFGLVLIPFSVCAAESPRELQLINQVLDNLHDAAAKGENARYLGVYSENAVFMGSAPEERMDKEQFTDYVNRRFTEGVGWAYQSAERNIFIAEDGNTAWFDEVITRMANGQNFRGTGVLIKENETWMVAQYNFSVPFANAIWEKVMEVIEAHNTK